jgi:hypothetical protein
MIPNPQAAVDRDATIRHMVNLDGVIKELQQERDRLDQAIAILLPLNGNRRTATATGIQRPTRTISPAGIARIRAAAKHVGQKSERNKQRKSN